MRPADCAPSVLFYYTFFCILLLLLLLLDIYYSFIIYYLLFVCYLAGSCSGCRISIVLLFYFIFLLSYLNIYYNCMLLYCVVCCPLLFSFFCPPARVPTLPLCLYVPLTSLSH